MLIGFMPFGKAESSSSVNLPKEQLTSPYLVLAASTPIQVRLLPEILHI